MSGSQPDQVHDVPVARQDVDDSLTTSAVLGDLPGVVRESAALVARAITTTSVTLGQVTDDSLLLTKWKVDRGMLSGWSSSVGLTDPDSPTTEAVEACDTRFVDDKLGRRTIHYPIASTGKAIGVFVVEIDPTDQKPTLETLAELSPRVALAIEHATLKNSFRSVLHETVTVLAAIIEGRDAYTERHCVNLAEMSLAVGLRMGLGRERLDLLTYGGLLHDIGKIAIPDSILNKPGALTESEFEEMKTHAIVGEEILGRVSALAEVGPIVGQHHERFDGRGYPRGLSGDTIILEARILAVADAFDAMTTTRPYRPALSWSRAIDTISSNAGTQFDPDVAQIFLRYLKGEEAQWRFASPV